MRGSKTRSPLLREEDGMEGGAGGCAGKKVQPCAGKSVGTEETRPATYPEARRRGERRHHPRPRQAPRGPGVGPDTPRGLTRPISRLGPQDTPPVSSGWSFPTSPEPPPAPAQSPGPAPLAGGPASAKMAASCVSCGAVVSQRLLLRPRVSLAPRQVLWRAAELQSVPGPQVRLGGGSAGPVARG